MAVVFNISGLSVKPLIQKYPHLIRYAAANALNDVGFDAKARLAQHAKRVFNNPKPLTVNAGLVYRKATPKNLDLLFGLKDKTEVPKGNPPDMYLYNQIYGGNRTHKKVEMALIYARKMPPNCFFIPINKGVMDQYGQMKGGEVTRMLSQLSAFQESGFRANIKNPNNSRYFTVQHRGDRGMLPPGVFRYMTNDRSSDGMVELIGLFVSRRPFYRKRYYYFETVEKALRMTFPITFNRRFQSMAAKRNREFNLMTGSSSSRRIIPLP